MTRIRTRNKTSREPVLPDLSDRQQALLHLLHHSPFPVTGTQLAALLGTMDRYPARTATAQGVHKTAGSLVKKGLVTAIRSPWPMPIRYSLNPLGSEILYRITKLEKTGRIPR